MARPGSTNALRSALSRLVQPSYAVPPPFFRPSTATPAALFASAAIAARPQRIPLFEPSYVRKDERGTGAHFESLRGAFYSPSACRLGTMPTPNLRSSPWAASLAQRAFHTSPAARGYRPYYGRGSAGGFHRRRDPTWRERIDSIPPMWVVGTLIALNLAVYAAWNYGYQLAQRFRDSSWLRFLQRNFTTSWVNFSQGRVWTLLTSAFSHEGASHILVNMASLL